MLRVHLNVTTSHSADLRIRKVIATKITLYIVALLWKTITDKINIISLVR